MENEHQRGFRENVKDGHEATDNRAMRLMIRKVIDKNLRME
jgi:hypothetical protein